MRSLAGDERAGVAKIIAATERRLADAQAESERIDGMYAFDEMHRQEDATFVLGLDEVGRGPLAGPLAVGGVILDSSVRIAGLNDSKLVSPALREEVASQVQATSVAWAVHYIEPERIDEIGMTASLKEAFRHVIDDMEDRGHPISTILLDGNPLHIDDREVSVVKGDRKSASIAASSIIAKVTRDTLMDSYDAQYPGYGFSSHKGYGTQAHQEAIRRLGLSPIHRRSFCRSFAQETVFYAVICEPLLVL